MAKFQSHYLIRHCACDFHSFIDSANMMDDQCWNNVLLFLQSPKDRDCNAWHMKLLGIGNKRLREIVRRFTRSISLIVPTDRPIILRPALHYPNISSMSIRFSRNCRRVGRLDPIQMQYLPPNLRELHFYGDPFYFRINHAVYMPKYVTSLTMTSIVAKALPKILSLLPLLKNLRIEKWQRKNFEHTELCPLIDLDCFDTLEEIIVPTRCCKDFVYPPNLIVLDIASTSCLKSMPKNLEYLSLWRYEGEDLIDFELLPRSLKFLNIDLNVVNTKGFLPPNLEVLKLSIEDRSILSAIPDDAKFSVFESNLFGTRSVKTIPNPQTILELCVHDERQLTFEMFSNLMTLHLCWTPVIYHPHIFDSLPPTIRVLYICPKIKVSSWKYVRWPKSLNVLVFHCLSDYTFTDLIQFLSSLPSGLLDFHLKSSLWKMTSGQKWSYMTHDDWVEIFKSMPKNLQRFHYKQRKRTEKSFRLSSLRESGRTFEIGTNSVDFRHNF